MFERVLQNRRALQQGTTTTSTTTTRLTASFSWPWKKTGKYLPYFSSLHCPAPSLPPHPPPRLPSSMPSPFILFRFSVRPFFTSSLSLPPSTHFSTVILTFLFLKKMYSEIFKKCSDWFQSEYYRERLFAHESSVNLAVNFIPFQWNVWGQLRFHSSRTFEQKNRTCLVVSDSKKRLET